jgi:hypothetical protein
MAINMSLDAKLYRGAAGETATTEVNTCKDVSLKIKKGEAKLSSRASRWALVKGSLKEAEFDVEFTSDSSDAHLQAIISAFISDTPLAFKIADKESEQGFDADFEIMEMDDEQKLEEGVTIKFTIKPTYVTRYPTWADGTPPGP